jgi:VacB/RNase II family 3'-5' exoribonuclease
VLRAGQRLEAPGNDALRWWVPARSTDTPRARLQHIARRAMIDRGLLPDFSPAATAEVVSLIAVTNASDSAASGGDQVRDLTNLPWCSIDNDDSRDLDQLSVAHGREGDAITVLVAVADVDTLVKAGSAVDEHAAHNTTSVYTAAQIFPMLPPALSTDLTSLNDGERRLALVVSFSVGPDGAITDAAVLRARVRNQAKLAYESVGAWLEGQAAAPAAITPVPGLDQNLKAQDEAAQRLRAERHRLGALSLETIQTRPVFEGDEIRDLRAEGRNRAKQLIEDFMIAANGVTARFLADRSFASIRRVVRSPKRWDRIEALAREYGDTLPAEPDPAALEAFLQRQRAAQPDTYQDLSLSVVKLLGAGEYVAERPGAAAPGHFGLAVKDYAHSTAPNRRYGDLVTQRLLKAAIAGAAPPYPFEALDTIATHLTQQEDAANKVERQVAKSAAALLLHGHIGEAFDAIVTGASNKGTWVRLCHRPVEGRLVSGVDGLDVGDRLRVRLLSTDVERGFIDFGRQP